MKGRPILAFSRIVPERKVFSQLRSENRIIVPESCRLDSLACTASEPFWKITQRILKIILI